MRKSLGTVGFILEVVHIELEVLTRTSENGSSDGEV